jgi:hypothetical protein
MTIADAIMLVCLLVTIAAAIDIFLTGRRIAALTNRRRGDKE